MTSLPRAGLSASPTGAGRRTAWATVGTMAAWVAGATVLTLVALSYLHPPLMLDLADRFWSCF